MRKIIILIINILFFTSCEFKSSDYYLTEAKKLESEGKYKEAISLLDKAIEKDPENINVLIHRGVDKSVLKDYEEGIKDFTRVIALDLDNALAFLNRGMNKQKLKNYQGAIEDFERAIKIKGSELLYIDKTENEYFDTGFEFDVLMEEVRFERGLARYNIDSLKLAFDDFNFCLNENYQRPASLYMRGLIYLAYEMNNEGCSDLIEALKLGNLDAQQIVDFYCE